MYLYLYTDKIYIIYLSTNVVKMWNQNINTTIDIYCGCNYLSVF